MAEQVNKMEDIKSRVQSTVGQVGGKVSDAAQDVVGTFQENKPLMYAGIALLAIGASLGIWALVRRFQSEETPSSLYGTDYSGSMDYRRSGAV